MKRAILSLALVVGASTLAAGCTAACEDSCEQKHDVTSCAEGDKDCVMRVGKELLTCVEACNE